MSKSRGLSGRGLAVTPRGVQEGSGTSSQKAASGVGVGSAGCAEGPFFLQVGGTGC